jgi:hypothetical protein
MVKRIPIAALAAVAAAAVVGVGSLTSAPAQAQGVYIQGGPGWHRGWRDDDDWRGRRRHWRAEEFGGCRTVVRRIWRDGERIIVRRRICD